MSAPRKPPFGAALGLWAGLGLLAALYCTWLGYGGRRFAFVLSVFLLFLAGEILLASGNTCVRLGLWLGPRGTIGLALLPLAAYLFYAAGTGSLGWWRTTLGTGYVLLPLLLVLRARRHPPAIWEDYAALLAIWLPVEFRRLHLLWPEPPALTHILTVLLALNVGLTTFLLVRRLEGVGYSISWGRGFAFAVGFHFLAFAAIAVPLGEAIGFLRFGPSLARLRALPLTSLGIILFTAWPEEFLFRGLLQNFVSRTMRSPITGWLVASAIFGLAHITNGPFPNWRYVVLASIAGLFYGRVWMKTGSLTASSLVHAMVDITWHALFR